jgi:hypothetical protein
MGLAGGCGANRETAGRPCCRESPARDGSLMNLPSWPAIPETVLHVSLTVYLLTRRGLRTLFTFRTFFMVIVN